MLALQSDTYQPRYVFGVNRRNGNGFVRVGLNGIGFRFNFVMPSL